MTDTTKKEEICNVCEHAACDEATEVYLDNDKDSTVVKDWFKSNFKKDFSQSEIDKHFKEHILPKLSDRSIIKRDKMRLLRSKSEGGSDSGSRIIQDIQQILWERIVNIYVSSKDELMTKEDKNLHMKQSKEIVDLNKAFRDNLQQQLEIIGMGKTEEEQKNLMENYVKQLLIQAIDVLGDTPEAQEKLSDFLNMSFKKGGVEDSDDFSEEELK